MPLAGRAPVQRVAAWLGPLHRSLRGGHPGPSDPLPAEPSLLQAPSAHPPLPAPRSGFVMNSPGRGHMDPGDASARSGFWSGSVRVLNIAFCEEGS